MGDFTNQVLLRRRIQNSLFNQPTVMDMAPEEEVVMPLGPSQMEMDADASASNYRRILEQGAPREADTHVGKGRRIMAGILGGFAGLRDPQAGYNAARGVVQGPYKAKLDEYNRQVGNTKNLAVFDESRVQDKAKRDHLFAQSNAEVERAKAEQARASYNNRRIVKWEPQTKEEAIELEGSKHPKVPRNGQQYKIQLEDGNIVIADIDPETGNYRMGNVQIPQNKVKNLGNALTKEGDSEPKTPYQAALDEWKSRPGNESKKPTAKDLKEILANSESASVQAGRAMNITLGGQRLENLRQVPSNTKFSHERLLRNDFNNNKVVQAYQVVSQNAINARNAWAMAEKALKTGGSLNTPTQVIITSLNKIMDPKSVVRESEYARTAQGQSLLNRLEGWFTKITQGGALSPAELKSVVDSINLLEQGHKQQYDPYVQQLTSAATEAGIDPKQVVGGQTAPQGGQEESLAEMLERRRRGQR
jgi:hypothetical protein